MVVEVQMRMPKNVFKRIKLTDSHSMNELVVHIFQMLRVKITLFGHCTFHVHTYSALHPTIPTHPFARWSALSARHRATTRNVMKLNEMNDEMEKPTETFVFR